MNSVCRSSLFIATLLTSQIVGQEMPARTTTVGVPLSGGNAHDNQQATDVNRQASAGRLKPVLQQDAARPTSFASDNLTYAFQESPIVNSPALEQPRLRLFQPAPPPHPVEEWLKPTFQMRGRIETDAIVAAQSAESQAIIGDLQNGYGLRRMRLGAQGTIGDDVHWVSEVELAGGTPRMRDVFVGLKMFPVIRELRAGNLLEPFSLEAYTSSNFITFMERSPLNELDPTYNWGVAGYWWPDNERMTAVLGLFRDGTNSGGQSMGDDDAWALTGRVTALPIYDPNEDNFRLLHVGIALSQRSPRNGIVEYSPGPASNLLTVSENPASPFLPTIIIPSDSQQLYNLQLAWVNGPLSIQSEWIATTVQQINAGRVFLHGFYVDASYFLTGEHRGYDTQRGAFDQVKVLRPVLRDRSDPRGGYGAIELAARFSYADFNSPNLPPAENGAPTGALLYQMTLGVNWYLNDYTRLMFNYTAAFPDVANNDPTLANIFSVRLGLFW
jgi:phosphate-selective porin OprO/OprP